VIDFLKAYFPGLLLFHEQANAAGQKIGLPDPD